MRKYLNNYFFHKRLRKQFESYWSLTAVLVGRSNFTIGKYAYIGSDCFINAEGGVFIGNGSVLSSKVTILSSTHDFKQPTCLPYSRGNVFDSVQIGSGVWIGYGATILPGVAISDGAIIGACSVVTKNVGTGEIIAGNPAKKIGTRDVEQIKDMVLSNSYVNKLHPRKWKRFVI